VGVVVPYHAPVAFRVTGLCESRKLESSVIMIDLDQTKVAQHAADERARLRAAIHAIVLQRAPDLHSPFGLDGYPAMWNLLSLADDPTTLAVRPTMVPANTGFGQEEVPGICWGWHQDGRWLAGKQHPSSTFDDFIEQVLLPELSAGAVLMSNSTSR